jgi:hypothetical protein
MTTEITPFEVTCEACKATLKVNRINLSARQFVPTDDPKDDGIVNCPACKAPLLKIRFETGRGMGGGIQMQYEEELP